MSLAQLADIFANVELTKYFSAIGFTILLYDSLLTFGDEVRLLWDERWTIVKVLFYVNRVLSFWFISINTYHLTGFAPPFSQTFCQVLILTTGYGAIICFGMTNWLLLARAIALWGNSRHVVWTMTMFFLVSYLATITMATVASLQLTPNIFYSPASKTCAVLIRPTTFGAIWVPSVVFEMVLFGLLLTKLIQHARQTSAGLTTRLIRTLYRDGITYLVVILTLRLFNLIAWASLPLSLIYIGIFLLWSSTTVLLTRMHLNLKAIGATTSFDEQSIDVIPPNRDLKGKGRVPIESIKVSPDIEFAHPSATPTDTIRYTISLPGPAIPISLTGPKARVPTEEREISGVAEMSNGRRWKLPNLVSGKRSKRRDAESGQSFELNSNIFPGGTRFDPDEVDGYHEHTYTRRSLSQSVGSHMSTRPQEPVPALPPSRRF